MLAVGVELTPPVTVTFTDFTIVPATKLTVTDVGTEFGVPPTAGLEREMVTGVPITPLVGLTKNAGASAPAVTTVVVNVPLPTVLIGTSWLQPTVVVSGETVSAVVAAESPGSPRCESIEAVSIAKPLESVTIIEALPQLFTCTPKLPPLVVTVV